MFRTFNASAKLDSLLHGAEAAARSADPKRSVDAKKADYEVANKEARSESITFKSGHCPSVVMQRCMNPRY